jgi:phosphatidylinositol 3-kinase
MTLNSFQEAQNQATIPLPPAAAPPVPPVLPSSFAADPHLWAILDPEIARENPVEDKHRRLVRSHRSSPYDRELKPNAKIRDELGVCIPVDCWMTFPNMS